MRTINLSRRQLLPNGAFLMYPEHSYLLREDSRRLSDVYWGLLSARVIFVFISLIVLVFCVYDINKWAQLAYRGQETQGLVTWKFTCCSYNTNPNVIYEYEMPFRGGIIRVQSISVVTPEFYGQVEKGTLITVRYLPDVPDSATLEWEFATPYTKLLFLAVAMLSVTYLTAKALACARSLRQLEHEGWVLSGRILSGAVQPVQLGSSLSVAYEFTTPDNQVLRGEETTVRSDLDGPPAPGTPIGVIYVSPQCYRLL